ncbi:hypothetical protein OROMI_022999 [Orobanche minor]
MDKSWMCDAKSSKSYAAGVKSFMQFVRTHMCPACDVRCPCKNCLNLRLKDQTTVTHHILENGIDTGYITWFYHGEPRVNDEGIRTHSDSTEKNNDEEEDGVSEMLFDLGEQYTHANNDNMPIDGNNVGGLPAYLEALMTDTQTELYPGCKKISKTSFIIQLLHLKVYNKLSNRAVDVMLSLMKSAFPDGETLPSTYCGAKKYLSNLGLGYECIHEWKKSPGKDIDVYLQPLVKELTELWVEGSVTFDVSCKQNFRMHAAVLWIINDFPAYGDLSGWVTEGYLACPVCNEQTCSQGLRNKLCFMGHRRNLSKDHPWSRSKKFNSKKEDGEPPRERLKSHDCHILLQRILPVGIRESLDKNVCNVLAELGHFFQRLCCKKLKRYELPKMGEDISLILCKLEQIYPPAFFDVMVHLSSHLPREALLGGPVQFRWMYPIKSSLCELKQSVHNKAHPEGSVAEAYIARECLTFCSMYLQGIETRFNRDERNSDIGTDDSLWIFSQKCRHLGAAEYVQLSEDEFKDMQWFVFQNCEEIEPFLEKHKQELMLEGSTNIDQDHKEKFPPWFKNVMLVRKYTGCIVNGVRFLTIERDVRRKTQNSGIVVEGNHGDDNIEFFGILTDIIHLDYVKGRHITVFKCEWFDLGTKKRIGIQKEGNITSIRVTGKWYENEPFIMADQARQVFYINDPKLGGEWRVVQPFQHRHIYDVDEMQDGAENIDEIQVQEEIYQEDHIDDAFDVSLGEIQSLHRENTNMEEIEQLITLGTPEVHEDVDLDSSEEDELDDTLVDYYSSDVDSQKISVSDDDSDDDNSSGSWILLY